LKICLTQFTVHTTQKTRTETKMTNAKKQNKFSKAILATAAAGIITASADAAVPKLNPVHINELYSNTPTVQTQKKEGDENKLKIFAVPIDAYFRVDDAYKNYTDVIDNNNVQEIQNVQGTKISGEVKFSGNDAAKWLKDYFAVLTANQFIGSGSYNINKQDYFAGFGGQGKDDTGTFGSVAFGYAFRNNKTNGRLEELDIDWDKLEEMSGFAIKAFYDLAGHPILNGLKGKIFQAFENGTEKMNVKSDLYNINISEQNPASAVTTQLDFIYNINQGLGKILNPKDNKILEGLLNTNLIQTLTWRDEIQNNNLSRYLDYQTTLENKGLQFGNMIIPITYSFRKTYPLALPQGANLQDSYEHNICAGIEFLPSDAEGEKK